MSTTTPRFIQRMQSFMHETYPDYDEQPLLSCKSKSLGDIESTFNSLKKRYDNRKLYNLNGVLAEARGKFNVLFNRIERQQFVPLINKLRVQAGPADPYSCDYLEHVIEELDGIIDHKREKVRHALERFSALSFILSLTDIIVSVVLIVIISFVSHFGQAHIQAAAIGILFIVLVAFFKVTLDRFFIMPLIHKRGWNVDRDNVAKYEDTIAKMESIILIAEHSIDEGESIITTLDIIHAGLDKLEMD